MCAENLLHDLAKFKRMEVTCMKHRTELSNFINATESPQTKLNRMNACLIAKVSKRQEYIALH